METDPERRRRGLETMTEIYGWEMSDGDGDFFAYTVEHLFADIWNRPGLSVRDRRLLLLGVLVGHNDHDVLPIQLGAAFANGELDEQALREIVVFLSHYAGWPAGARLFTQVEKVLADAARAAARAAEVGHDADTGTDEV
jgi:4-carboxymuconolactone decarboxylase